MINIDTGMAVVIVAVLIFYLRLIIIQRERAKRLKRAALVEQSNKPGKKKSPKNLPKPSPEGYSILSPNRLDRWIGIGGGILIVLGIVINLGILPPMGSASYDVIHSLWWIPTALGIIAFSWMFKL